MLAPNIGCFTFLLIFQICHVLDMQKPCDFLRCVFPSCWCGDRLKPCQNKVEFHESWNLLRGRERETERDREGEKEIGSERGGRERKRKEDFSNCSYLSGQSSKRSFGASSFAGISAACSMWAHVFYSKKCLSKTREWETQTSRAKLWNMTVFRFF